jgi:hypothetical protein
LITGVDSAEVVFPSNYSLLTTLTHTKKPFSFELGFFVFFYIKVLQVADKNVTIKEYQITGGKT